MAQTWRRASPHRIAARQASQHVQVARFRTFGSLTGRVDHSSPAQRGPFADAITNQQIASQLQLALPQNEDEWHDNFQSKAVMRQVKPDEPPCWWPSAECRPPAKHGSLRTD
jgi:hypothetical protein